MSTFDCEDTYFLSDFTPASLISGYRDPIDQSKPTAVKTPKRTKKQIADEAAFAAEYELREQERKINESIYRAERGEEPEPVAPDPQPGAAPTDPGDEKDYSLLPALNGKVLVIKDFTLIHDKPAETRAQILSILRDVYDGYSSRKLGNGDTKGYKSRFGLLAGMTPDIEKSWSLNTLGERFLMYRMVIANRRAHARKALDGLRTGTGGTDATRNELRTAVKEFLGGIEHFVPEVDAAMREQILDLAEILSTCRTYVVRDRNDDMPCLPQAEMATRVAKQLYRAGVSLALVRGRRAVTSDEFRVMKKIALDSLPTNRRLLLGALWEFRETPQPLWVFAERVSRISSNTVRKELENLAELGVVERVRQSVVMPKTTTTRHLYKLSEAFEGHCGRVGGVHTPPDICGKRSETGGDA